MTVNYDVSVSDGSTTSTQTVSVVITGANDAVAITSGPESGSVSEQVGVTGSTSLDSTSPVPTGTLAFSDVDLNDTHSVGVIGQLGRMVHRFGIVPDTTLAELQAALLTSLSDSTGTGSGGIDWSFAIQDRFLDFLSAGETLTITYDVTVSDGITTSTQQVTVTATGAEDPLTVNAATGTGFDSAGMDTDSIIAVGNVITDAGDTGGDQSVTLSVTDVNGSAANVGNFVAGAYGNLLLFEDGYVPLSGECQCRSVAGRRQRDRRLQLHRDRQPRPHRVHHADDQCAGHGRCARGHCRERVGHAHRGRRADCRRQWRLRDRRSDRLDLVRRHR